MKLLINWEHKRVKHAIERMWLRGVSVKDVEEAILKGKKIMQKQTGLMQSVFKRYIMVYGEEFYPKLDIRMAFPVTVRLL